MFRNNEQENYFLLYSIYTIPNWQPLGGILSCNELRFPKNMTFHENNWLIFQSKKVPIARQEQVQLCPGQIQEGILRDNFRGIFRFLFHKTRKFLKPKLRPRQPQHFTKA